MPDPSSSDRIPLLPPALDAALYRELVNTPPPPAERIPHLPLWLYRENWRDGDTDLPGEGDDAVAIEAFRLRREREFERRAERNRRTVRVVDDEVEAS